jgi:hypothetical protein
LGEDRVSHFKGFFGGKAAEVLGGRPGESPEDAVLGKLTGGIKNKFSRKKPENQSTATGIV